MGDSKWKSHFHVVIIGCGIGGLTAAIGIRRAGYKATILEQSPELREIGAGIQVPSNATRVLQQMGVLEEAARHSIKPQSVIWRSYQDGHVIGRQSLSPFTEKVYGLPHFSIHRCDYQAVLLKKAQQLGADIKLGQTVSGFDLSNGLVILGSSGEVCKADLIIGADGGRSICRDTLIGRMTAPTRSGEIALRLTTSAKAIRQNQSTADLLSDNNLDIWVGPQAHVVSYLLVRNDQFNMVLTQPDLASNEHVDTKLQNLDIVEVRQKFGGWDPRLRTILDMASQAAQTTLGQIADLETWVDKSSKLVLLGDSAHPMLPYLAQGAAMAVEDAAVLATLLDVCMSRSDVPRLLQVYDSLRRPRAIKIKNLSHGMRYTLGQNDGPQQEERDRKIALGFSDDHPVPYGNPVYQDWMWGYDAIDEAKKAWDQHLTSKQKGEESTV